MLKSILSAWPATTHQRPRKAWGSYDNKRRKNVSCRRISSQNGALMSLIWPVEFDQFIRCGTHIFAGYAAMHILYDYICKSKTCNRRYIITLYIYIYIHGQINRPVSQCHRGLWICDYVYKINDFPIFLLYLVVLKISPVFGGKEHVQLLPLIWRDLFEFLNKNIVFPWKMKVKHHLLFFDPIPYFFQHVSYVFPSQPIFVKTNLPSSNST